MAYFWGTEEAEHIFDSAPPRRTRKVTKKVSKKALKCLSHDKELQEQFIPVLDDLYAEWPCPLVNAIKKNVDQSLCSCDKGKVPVLNIPRGLFEESISKCYIFFQNVFNLIDKDTPSGKLIILKEAIHEMVEDCAVQKEVTRYIFLQSIKTLFVAAVAMQELADSDGSFVYDSRGETSNQDSDVESTGSETER